MFFQSQFSITITITSLQIEGQKCAIEMQILEIDKLKNRKTVKLKIENCKLNIEY